MVYNRCLLPCNNPEQLSPHTGNPEAFILALSLGGLLLVLGERIWGRVGGRGMMCLAVVRVRVVSLCALRHTSIAASNEINKQRQDVDLVAGHEDGRVAHGFPQKEEAVPNGSGLERGDESLHHLHELGAAEHIVLHLRRRCCGAAATLC